MAAEVGAMTGGYPARVRSQSVMARRTAVSVEVRVDRDHLLIEPRGQGPHVRSGGFR